EVEGGVEGIGLRGMHEDSIRVGLGENRREEAVEGGVLERETVEERAVRLPVEADRELVVGAGGEKPVHEAAVVVLAPALPRVVGIGMRAALVVSRAERERRLERARVVGVRELAL